MLKFGTIAKYFSISIILTSLSACGETSQESKDELMEIMGMEGNIHHDNKSLQHTYFLDPLGYTPENIVHTPIDNTDIPSGRRNHDRIKVNNLGSLAEVFNDSNKYQYAWAEKLGIRPISSLNDAYRTSRPLVKISDCEAYGVDKLTHSLPYLVPEAADLLKTIGYNFIDSLAKRGADGYKVKVTSLLRTPATVKSLRKVNPNATDSSTHQFGTTFDISWSNFICADPSRTIHEGDLKNLLAEVLHDLHNQKRCMVKFERKTACFHITVTKPE